MRKLQLNTKIISGFGAVLLLMAVVIGVYQYAITQALTCFKSELVSSAINQYAAKIESLSLQADHNELAFLASKDVKYADGQQGIIKELTAAAEGIRQIAEQEGKGQIKEKSVAIGGQAQQYLSRFDLMVAAQKEAGLDEKRAFKVRSGRRLMRLRQALCSMKWTICISPSCS